MANDQPTYQVKVDRLLVDRNNLGWVGRFAAAINGRWPKVLLHKMECPCCGKVTFHRAIQKDDPERSN
jgi:hypothetical protein